MHTSLVFCCMQVTPCLPELDLSLPPPVPLMVDLTPTTRRYAAQSLLPRQLTLTKKLIRNPVACVYVSTPPPFRVPSRVNPKAAADPMDPNTRSMTACFRHVYKTAGGGVPGVRRFFRGVSTTVVRAVPVNAAIFPTFEWTVKVLNKAFPSSS